jgi:glycine/D-amino acid oxidase-like deaminating enzyme
MSLHTGLSYWKAIEAHPLVFPPLAGDAACEVAVIGGGVTGALVSYLLIEVGVQTLLVDKRQPAAGSTAASTGLLQYEVDTHLADLIAKVGRDRAVHAYRRGLRAIDELEELSQKLERGCGFARRPSLYVASNWCDLRSLRREFECRREHGLPVEFLSRRQLAGITSIKAGGAIRSQGDAQINPLDFTCKLLVAAQRKGLRVAADTGVTGIEETAQGCRVQTGRGKVQSAAVVIATGYEAHELLKLAPGNLQSTYVVTSEPLTSDDGWPEKSLIWETARPYFYARQSDDGRAMIGGADTAFANDHQRDGLVARKVNELQTQFRKRFPRIEFVPAYAWAGTFAETKDGLAYIGLPSGKARTYCALGYGGNGITFSMIAARLIVDLFCGRPNPDAQVFSFQR